MIASLITNVMFWLIDTLVMLAETLAILFRGVRYD